MGALATYFGERPLEVALYDADRERLELFARFAWVAFKFNKAPHQLEVCESLQEMALLANKAILCLDDHGAAALIRSEKWEAPGERVAEASRHALQTLSDDVETLDLTGKSLTDLARYRLPLPPEPSEEELRALPHQLLRWIRGEEYLHEFLAEHEKSPIRDWLERPESALIG